MARYVEHLTIRRLAEVCWRPYDSADVLQRLVERRPMR